MLKMGGHVPSPTPGSVFQKDQWEIDLKRRELRSRQVTVPVGGRAFEIIEALVERAGQTLTKKDLMARVWPGSIVEDNTLQVHIAAVRRALGTDRDLLKTVSGRGYRLVGNWHIARTDEPRSEIDGPPSRRCWQANLPQRSSELIGRHHSIRQLRDLASAYRLVTLTGPGGIGKTALAWEVARELGPSFDDNVQLVELAPMVDPDLVTSAVASVLGPQLVGGEISPAAIAQAIGASRLLLILDNCEHVVDAVARFAETILRRCGQATILATSRELLHIDGEYAYRVAPLDTPPEGAQAVDTALEYSAMTLFLARMQVGRGTFALNETNLPSAIAICRRLDGIPLALELAAARATTLGVDEVASRLDDRFGLLTSGRRTALPRHRTLRAMLDWSYDLLPNTERIILQRLAVFVGGFTLEAASAVGATADMASRDVADGLVSLCFKSLVGVEQAAGQPRYSLLETVRAYAFEKLRETADLAATRLRHARYFQRLFERAEAERGTRLITDWLAIYARELDNVRTAIDWAFSVVEHAPVAVELCADSIAMMFDLSLVGEGRRRAETALSAIDAGVQVPPRREMQVLAILQATRIYTDGPSDAGCEAWKRVLAIGTEFDDLDYQIRALWGLWNDNLYGGWPMLSLSFARQFRQLTATLSDPVISMTASVLGPRLIGTALHYCGDQNAARPHLEHVLSHYVRRDHRWKVLGSRLDHATVTRATFSRVLWLQGYPDQARNQANLAMQDAVADDHLMSVLYVLVEAIIPISLFAGDLPSVRRFLGTMLEQAPRAGFRIWQTFGRCFQAVLQVNEDERTTGLPRLVEAIQELEETGFCAHLTMFLGILAQAQLRSDAGTDALRTINRALDRCDSHQENWFTSELLRIKSDVLLRSGEEPEAADHLRRALELSRQQGTRLRELRAATDFARLLMRQGQGVQARAVLAPVYEWFTEGFETTADLRAAREVIQLLPDD